MLFDFFGELLTEKQREYFDLHYNEDYSLSEIAEQAGVSRQGVWDIIHRAELTLCETEEKTGIIARFSERNEILSRLESELAELRQITSGRASEICNSIAKGLTELKG